MRAFALATAFAVSVASTAASACSCGPWSDAATILAGAGAVVVAQPLTNSVVVETNADGDQVQRTLFTTTKKYKGPMANKFSVFTIRDTGGNCGVNFAKNSGQYLILGYFDGTRLYTESCGVKKVNARDRSMRLFLRDLDAASRGRH